MPWRLASSGDAGRYGWPSIAIVPASARSAPASTFISVLLPAPFSPMSAWTCPAWSSKLTPSSATVGAEALLEAVDAEERHHGVTECTMHRMAKRHNAQEAHRDARAHRQAAHVRDHAPSVRLSRWGGQTRRQPSDRWGWRLPVPASAFRCAFCTVHCALGPLMLVNVCRSPPPAPDSTARRAPRLRPPSCRPASGTRAASARTRRRTACRSR